MPLFLFPLQKQIINIKNLTLMNSIIKFSKSVLLIATICFVAGSCKKDEHIPPNLTFKTGAGYTSGNATVSQNEDITVGITAIKKEDDMLTYNVSYAFDGASTTNTLSTFNLTGAEQQNYDKDVTFTTRGQAGTEKWIFTITDKDGNIAQQQIVLTVQ